MSPSFDIVTTAPLAPEPVYLAPYESRASSEDSFVDHFNRANRPGNDAREASTSEAGSRPEARQAPSSTIPREERDRAGGGDQNSAPARTSGADATSSATTSATAGAGSVESKPLAADDPPDENESDGHADAEGDQQPRAAQGNEKKPEKPGKPARHARQAADGSAPTQPANPALVAAQEVTESEDAGTSNESSKPTPDGEPKSGAARGAHRSSQTTSGGPAERESAATLDIAQGDSSTPQPPDTTGGGKGDGANGDGGKADGDASSAPSSAGNALEADPAREKRRPATERAGTARGARTKARPAGRENVDGADAKQEDDSALSAPGAAGDQKLADRPTAASARAQRGSSPSANADGTPAPGSIDAEAPGSGSNLAQSPLEAEKTSAAEPDPRGNSSTPPGAESWSATTPSQAQPTTALASLPGGIVAPGHRALPATTPAATTVDVERARFVQRVTRAFQAANERGGQIRLRLSPPELGSLRLDLQIRDNAIIARVEAETTQARSILLESLPLLRERLAAQGMQVERFDVDLSGQSSGGLPQTRDQPFARDDAGRRGTQRGRDSVGGAPLPAAAPRRVGDARQLDVTI